MQPKLFQLSTSVYTPRTVLRRFREGDGKAFFQLIKKNYKRLEKDFPKTIRATRDPELTEFYLRERIANWLLQKEYAFLISSKHSGELMGYIRLFRIDWKIRKAELGYFIDEAYAGKGLMSEIVKTVCNFGFQQLELHKLVIMTSTENVASQRVAEKCGFEMEGVVRGEFVRLNGEVIDTVLYGRLN